MFLGLLLVGLEARYSSLLGYRIGEGLVLSHLVFCNSKGAKGSGFKKGKEEGLWQ